MDMPKTTSAFCGNCNTHTEHKLKHFKSGSPSALSWGARHNEAKHKSGYGGKARFVATVKKQSKKPTFVAECSVCKKKHYKRINKKMKKVELK